MCSDPAMTSAAAAKALARPGAELLVPAHRELELRAVRLDGEWHSGRGADRRSEEDVVREEEVGRQVLAHGGGVPFDEVLPLRGSEVLEVAGLHVLVAVEHEDRERPVEQRPDDRGAAEVVLLRMGLLAEDDDLVAEPSPRPRERPRIDVRPRPAQEVAVPNENLHAWKILTHRWSSGRSEATAGHSSSSSSGTRTASSRSRRERSARRTRRPTRSRRPLSGPGSACLAFAAARSSRRGSTASASMRPTTSG